MPLLILSVPASDVPMHQWSLTLHGPGGILGTLESGETQFVLGTEQATDVWTIAGEGVAVRHALVRVAAGRIEVEDLAGGTLVNGHPITGLVEAEDPASVQVGEVTLVVEQKGEAPSQAATLVQNPRQEGAPLGDLEVTVVTPRAAAPVIAQKTVELNEAEALCKYTLVREIAQGGMGQIYFWRGFATRTPGRGEGQQHQRRRRRPALHKGGEGARAAGASEYRTDLQRGRRCPRAAVLFDEIGQGTHTSGGAQRA